MRSFPVEDNDGIVKNIIEQLSDLIDSGEGNVKCVLEKDTQRYFNHTTFNLTL